MIDRIGVQEAHQNLESDPDALLVCAYDEGEKFDKYHLEGALSLYDFEARADLLPADREIILYCA